MSLAATRRDGPGLAEVFGVWVLYALFALTTLLTYSRLPPGELYHVSASGAGAAAGRALVYVNFPVALAALAVLPVVLDQLAGRRAALAGVAAAVLCASVAWPGIVDEGDLDARPVNVLPALGVALALGLTAAAAGRGGRSRGARRAAGDRARVVLGAGLAAVAVPWVAAELGVGFSGVPVLGDVFQSDEHWAPLGEARVHAAVHAGGHHGMHGVLLVATVLLLSRALPELRSPRLRTVLSLYLALTAAYGIGNLLNDAWLEQIVKRGWTERHIPSVVNPAPTLPWLVVLLGAAAIHVVLLRRLEPRAESATGSQRRPVAAASAYVLSAAVLVLAAVGAVNGGRELSPPSPPPAVGRIAFVSVGERFDVFLLGPDGARRNLTPDPGRDLAPAWSADGRRVTFQSDRDGGTTLYVVTADGSRSEVLTRGPSDGEPASSAGAARLTYVCDGRICARSPSGGVRIEVDAGDPRWPSSSPDGASITFDAKGEGGRDIYVTPTGVGEPGLLVGGPADDRFARWSPDGRRLAFVSDRAGDFDLWVARADGSAPRRVTDGAGNDFGPAWSPDGRWLAFVSDREGRDQLYAIRPDGSGLRRLTRGDTDKEAPSWGPEPTR
jgi:hypothetical protein